MSNNLVIKNDSFIQSMHNNIQCIESLDPNDKGTSRQYWFTTSMLANIFDISKDTVRNNVNFLMKWGEVTVAKFLATVQMSSSSGAVNDTVENTDDFGGNESLYPNNSIKINNNGMKFINESGLYTLIARSNKHEARRFQR